MNSLNSLNSLTEPVSQCSFKFQNPVIDGGGIKRE